jgi:hypothetical protein
MSATAAGRILRLPVVTRRPFEDLSLAAVDLLTLEPALILGCLVSIELNSDRLTLV